MRSERVQRSTEIPLATSSRFHGTIARSRGQFPLSDQSPSGRHPVYQMAWYLVNGLLAFAILVALYSIGWEYSTRRYLTGFSDAIVPATAPPDEKIDAILNWMAHGPARQTMSPIALAQDRDPTDTLNYDALLKVCGTATNAFINLVDSGGLMARRLLLLDSHQLTKHVVAEVLVNGRWIVVDPAYRVLLRSPEGKPLTRNELTDPVTLTAATQHIPNYDPNYTYDHTAQIRLARLRFIGSPLRDILNRLRPNWESSTTITLLLERESFAAMVVGILLSLFLLILRTSVRWYGRRRLGIHPLPVRERLLQAWNAFLNPTG
jgi:hypothetical protein